MNKRQIKKALKDKHYRLIDKWFSRMQKAGKTQEQLAELAGISGTQLSKIIRYKVPNPKKETVEAVEKVLEGLGV